MRRRVVYVRAGGVALRSPHDALGRAGEGAWVAVDDETLDGWLASETPHRLLWFDRTDYDAAVRALPDEQIARVVHLRLERWTPRAAAATLPAMIARERQLVAAGAARAPYVEAALARLTRLSCDGSYALLPLDDRLRIAVADETRLAEEEDEAGNAQAAMRRRQQALALSAARGQPARSDALPAVTVWRVYVAEPTSETLELIAERQGWSRLRDGARLILLAGREAAEKVPSLGTRVTMLSVDSAAYTMLSEDTPAQRARDLATLVPDDARRLAVERARLIDELRFSQLAQKLQLASSGIEAATRQIAGDTSELLASLRARGGAPPLARAHAEALADASLFATLARREGFVALAAMLDDELHGLQATGVE